MQLNLEKRNKNSEIFEINSSKKSIKTKTSKKEKIFVIKNIRNIKEQRKNKEKIINEGRWSFEEHEKFIEALIEYGNNWKKIQEYIGTRTIPQTRSHSQKFFLKLKTIKNKDLNIDLSSNNIRNLVDVIALMKSKNENKENEKKFLINAFITLSETIKKICGENIKRKIYQLNLENNFQINLENNELNKTSILNNRILTKNEKEEEKIEIKNKINIIKNDKEKNNRNKDNPTKEIAYDQLFEEKEIKLIKDDSWILKDNMKNQRLIFEDGLAFYINDYDFPIYNNSIRNIEEIYYYLNYENSTFRYY